MSTPQVRLRGGFSDREGIKKENSEIQLKSLDERTRIALVNNIRTLWITVPQDSRGVISMSILADVYLEDIGQYINDLTRARDGDLSIRGRQMNDIAREQIRNMGLEKICDTIKSAGYGDVLTVVEYLIVQICQALYKGLYSDEAQAICSDLNDVLKKEFVGYRLVNEQIVPISNEIEIEAIEQASRSPYEQVNVHLSDALRMLSDRDNPDYRNSIKESITAVERICSILLGKSSETLSVALKKMEAKGISIHPCLKQAFEKLYNYTSDAKGVRHAGQLDGPDATFEEAKFMLVSCCAFVNYLIGIMAK